MSSVVAQRPRSQDIETSKANEANEANESPRPTAARGRAPVRICRRVFRRRPAKPGRRLDIQGLRAVCMIQVLGFHAWRIGSPIGVDAFIMISAYLMTGAFVRRAEAGRTPWVVERWLHTFKRLMPPLVVTVLITVAASLLVLPRNRWIEVLVQGAASVTYWQNWRLAAVSADYFADNHAVSSPLQHLWSMSMQGQVFLLWPVLMAVCAGFASLMRLSVRRVVAVAFAALAAVSLTWLITAAPADGSVYFDTRARIWEFALGSAIAAAAPRLRPRRAWARWLASWLGLGALVLFCLVSIGTYPGPMAAVPMAAVAAILLCDTGPRGGTVSHLLSWRPLVALGDCSYAVYLVHWPLFVLYLTATDQETFDLRTGATLIAIVLVAATIMTWGVDRPAQVFPRSGRRLGIQAAMVVTSLVVGGIPLGVAGGAIAYQREQEIAQQIEVGVDPDHPGALALGKGQASEWTKPPVPGPLAVTAEWVSLSGTECDEDVTERVDSENSSCRRLPSSSDEAVRAVVVGDSHAAQNIVPTLRLLHDTEDWDITAYLKGACSFGLPEYYKGSCRDRNSVALEQIEADPPDVVVLQTTETAKDSSSEVLRPGIKRLVEQLTGEGIAVIGFRDNPRSDKSLYECASTVGPETMVGGCVFPKEDVMAAEDPAKLLEEMPLFHQIDAGDMLCPGDVCGTIIGDVFVYMDDNHVSATYSRTMAPELASRIKQAMGIEQPG
ncbi:acyltransferase family protein [Actinomyces israelii]|uniref:Acyltransferase family protein n=1 Tax=Actinomyces israelii TaxID=1659 RepID=A0ABT4I9I2_9ACTO|nr:acyltransferase family protein [Actinomyces israelii]MCZ0858196.1 acyltransferase family protein [Actinomyces israelii]